MSKAVKKKKINKAKYKLFICRLYEIFIPCLNFKPIKLLNTKNFFNLGLKN